MKAKAHWLLEEAKMRAFSQIAYALKKMKQDGNYGSPWAWFDADGTKHEDTAYHSHLEAFRLCEWGGEENQPCFYDYNSHTWDTVYNLPVEKLIMCADSLLCEMMYNRQNRN